MQCGLLGRKIGYSYSPMIQGMLASYRYDLFPTEPEELDGFLRGNGWDGLNVTIPYKREVVRYCAELSETAAKLGSVNTLVRRADGTILGANTDYDGFRYQVEQSGIGVAEKGAGFGQRRCVGDGVRGAARPRRGERDGDLALRPG